jgi:hypothetical protein
LRPVAQPDDSKAGYHFVRGAEEFSCNLLGLPRAGGLADYLAGKIYNGIGPDDHAVREALGNALRLGQSQVLGVFIGPDVTSRKTRLIDIWRNDLELIACLR